MVSLGTAFREIRGLFGATQVAMADMLDCTPVHLCNVEKDNTEPSRALCERFAALTGIDPYVYGWATQGDVERLPKAMQFPAKRLAQLWRAKLERPVGKLVLNRAVQVAGEP